MTWQEFKEAVDKQLADLGFDDTFSIWYIDVGGISLWDPSVELVVSVDEQLGLSVG